MKKKIKESLFKRTDYAINKIEYTTCNINIILFKPYFLLCVREVVIEWVTTSWT